VHALQLQEYIPEEGAETKAVLSSIASDCRVEGGDCLNAVEVFWTPSEPSEILTERDAIVDFPELITL